jgi:putative heme-binding domain-containing protein
MHRTSSRLFLLLLSHVCSIVWMAASRADERPDGVSGSGSGRIAWTSSRLHGSPDPPPPFRVERVFPQLRFDSPVTIVDLPSRGRRLVLERRGRLLTFSSDDDPDQTDLAFDLAEHVQAVDGLSFAAARDCTLDPNFADNGYVYVVWSMGAHLTEAGSRVTRFTLLKSDPPRVDPASRLDVISYPSGDHIGACLRFGPDGMLYVCTGDGALPFPPDRHLTAQNLSDLRGSVLRLDVKDATLEHPYRIPTDNPFVDTPGTRGEIYAFGIRNGFRAAFNPVTGRLWVADVGWERCELIHRIEKGGNHGWSLYEGPYPVNPDQKPGPGERIPPAIVLERDQAQSVTGGVFIHPSASIAKADPSVSNNYVFGCYMNGVVWTADVSDPQRPVVRVAADTGLRVIDFASTKLDATPEGESDLLVLDFGGGGVYRLTPNEITSLTAEFPRHLSQTGLFVDLSSLEPAPGVTAFHPRATMYRGGAVGSRVIGLPGAQPIGRDYPSGTVIANTLSREVMTENGERVSKRLETQILLFDGLNWDPYTYRWNDDQSDATLVESSGDRITLTIPDSVAGEREVEYVFASRAQCNTCHHVFNQGPVTFNVDNLSGDFSHQDAKTLPPWVQTRWSDLAEAGIVQPRKSDQSKLMVDPYDSSKNLDQRARSYLAINCSCCHRPAGGATSALHLQRWVQDDALAAINERPTQGDFGIDEACVIKPGDPARSVLLYRVATSGPGKMPKLGGHEPDLDGANLLWDWIESISKGETRPSRAPREHPPVNPRTTDQALEIWKDLTTRSPPKARIRATELVAGTTDAAISGLFYRWLADEDRQEFVGETPEVEKLLAMVGDADRGRRWYKESTSSQCRNCHHVEGSEALIGPSLAGLATRRKRFEVLDHLIHPSKEIAPQWQTHSILTIDGDVLAGLKVAETEDEVVLKSADGRDHKVSKDDIASSRTNPLSLMPSGLLASMTPQQVADLLAYLMTLNR